MTLDIYTIVVLSILIGAVVHYVSNRFDGKKAVEDLEVCYQGMADAFKGVVMLLVGAGLFAQGLMSVGAIDTLLGLADKRRCGRSGTDVTSYGYFGGCFDQLVRVMPLSMRLLISAVTCCKNGYQPSFLNYSNATSFKFRPYDFASFRGYCCYFRYGTSKPI